MRIIVALDILQGKCVRLTKGDYKTPEVYNNDPLDAAKEIADNGIGHLHIVDLDGAREKRIINHRLLEKICISTELRVDFGGGIRSDEDLKIAFSSGAKQVTAGSVAVKAPALFTEWLEKYGSDKIILGADFRNRTIATEGWTEDSDNDILSFISGYYKKGIKYVICTDIEKDGTLKGPSADVYREIIEKVNIKLIASGGISTVKDIEAMKDLGCEAAIVGKAVYEGKIKLGELSRLC
jgi:phosphoribosylformimino-5-aminoimidazole carboxamide ribotide isomerase